MRTIVIPKPNSDSFVNQLASLYTVFKGATMNEDLSFDLSQLSFTYPFLILPICSYINTTNSSFSIGDGSRIKSYLETIRFPKGVSSVSEFQKQTHKTKNYIPISVLQREEPSKREQLESLFSTLVYKTINKAGIEGIMNSIYYPITELVTNIFEHSKQDKGFIFGQFHQNINALDICIVDRGRGLAMAYQEEKELVLSDENAIAEVMEGNSIKPDKERGYGVRTSKNVVCKALGGQFILISGSAALASEQGRERLVSLPEFSWKGVVIAYRIPIPQQPIDISPYLE